jgi:hypothetical protein
VESLLFVWVLVLVWVCVVTTTNSTTTTLRTPSDITHDPTNLIDLGVGVVDMLAIGIMLV